MTCKCPLLQVLNRCLLSAIFYGYEGTKDFKLCLFDLNLKMMAFCPGSNSDTWSDRRGSSELGDRGPPLGRLLLALGPDDGRLSDS